MAKAIINCNTQEAEIRYTTDNSDVTEDSPVYSGQLDIEAGTTVKAKAFKIGMNPSNQVSLKSLDKLQTPTLTLSRNASTINISIGNTVSGASYRYKIGSAPTSPTDGTAITNTATLDNVSAVTIYVRGWYTGTYNPSDVAMDSVTAQPTCATPVISQNGNTVTITCSTSGATIYYRRGSSGAYSVYNDSFTISATTTVYAYATAPDYIQSDEVSQECVFANLKLPTPVVTQGEGGYIEGIGNYAIMIFVNGNEYSHLRSTLKMIIDKTYMDAYLELMGLGSGSASLETDESGNYIFNVATDTGDNFLSANSNFGEYIINDDEVPTFKVKFRNENYEDSEWGSCTYQMMKLKTPTLSLSRSNQTVNGTVGNREGLATYRYKVGSAPASETDGSAVSSNGTFSFTNEGAITVYVRAFKVGYTMSDAVSDSVSAYVPPTPMFPDFTKDLSITGYAHHYYGVGVQIYDRTLSEEARYSPLDASFTASCTGVINFSSKKLTFMTNPLIGFYDTAFESTEIEKYGDATITVVGSAEGYSPRTIVQTEFVNTPRPDISLIYSVKAGEITITINLGNASSYLPNRTFHYSVANSDNLDEILVSKSNVKTSDFPVKCGVDEGYTDYKVSVTADALYGGREEEWSLLLYADGVKE